MESKVKDANIIVTGANGGIGIEVVKQLIELHPKRIVLACRSQEKANDVAKYIDGGSTVIEPLGGFDMNNFHSIKSAVKQLHQGEKFDIVFLQSGGMVVSDKFRFVEVNGIRVERTVHQNAIGGWLTVQCLLELNLIQDDARVVFAGGEGARGIPRMIRKPDFRTRAELIDYISSASGDYNALDAIGVSKMVSALLIQKLAEIDMNRSYVWFSPGLTGGTKGLDALENPKRFVMKHIGFPIMQLFGIAQGPVKAAEKYIRCLNAEIGQSGDLIGAPEGKALGKLVDQKPMNAALTNHQLVEGIWELVMQLYPEAIQKHRAITH